VAEITRRHYHLIRHEVVSKAQNRIDIGAEKCPVWAWSSTNLNTSDFKNSPILCINRPASFIPAMDPYSLPNRRNVSPSLCNLCHTHSHRDQPSTDPRAHAVPAANRINVTVVHRQGKRAIDPWSLNRLLSHLANHSHYSVRVARLESMSLTQQIVLMSQTGILIGAHGLGLVHVLWIQQWPKLMVEIFPPDSYLNDYQLLAAIASAKHFAWDASNGLLRNTPHLLGHVCPSTSYIPYGNVHVPHFKIKDVTGLTAAIDEVISTDAEAFVTVDHRRRDSSVCYPPAWYQRTAKKQAFLDWVDHRR